MDRYDSIVGKRVETPDTHEDNVERTKHIRALGDLKNENSYWRRKDENPYRLYQRA